jgi:hypothetical protein
MIVNDVYVETCNILLEDGGLTLEILTESEFLSLFTNVIQDWCQATSLVKVIVNLPVVAGTSQYTVPDYAMQVQEVFYSEQYINRETAGSLDHLRRNWKSESSATIQDWHEDRLPSKGVQVRPNPSLDGYTVAVAAAFYGTISVCATNVNVRFLCPAGLYGTISSYASAVYVESAGPMFGTIASLTPSTKNLKLVATAKPFRKTWALTDYIEVVPDSFVHYLKYGILAAVFSSDGEMKDDLRARYCQSRWEEGVGLASAVSQEGIGV